MTSALLAGETWLAAKDGDWRALGLYRRHYSSRKRRHDAPREFVGPYESLVLLTPCSRALFVWTHPKYRADGEVGVNCAVFRNEGAGRSSDLIRAAAERAWELWPGERLYTFVDPREIASSNPGYCFKIAGWRYERTTPKGLHVLALAASSNPAVLALTPAPVQGD